MSALRRGLLLLAAALPASALADEYTQMLGYLAGTQLDGDALRGARGAIAVNQAAGDLNLQANLRSLAVGGQALGTVAASQQRHGDRHTVPLQAQARLGGNALAGAAGIASINQASGSANAETNALVLELAHQRTRGATDGMPAVVDASAERQTAAIPAGRTASRNVAVEATALRGFEGVLQLNQIAGSANATGNQLLLSVAPGP